MDENQGAHPERHWECRCGGPVVDGRCLWCYTTDLGDVPVDADITPWSAQRAFPIGAVQYSATNDYVAQRGGYMPSYESDQPRTRRPPPAGPPIDASAPEPEDPSNKVEIPKSLVVCGHCMSSDCSWFDGQLVCFACKQPRPPLRIRPGPLEEDSARMTQDTARQWLQRVRAPQHKIRRTQWAQLMNQELPRAVWRAILTRLPFPLLMGLKAARWPCMRWLDVEIEHNSLLRQEWKLRRAYAQHESSEAPSLEQRDLTSSWVLNPFDSRGRAKQQLFRQRRLCELEESHFALVESHEANQKPDSPKWLTPGELSIVDKFEDFQNNFHALTNGIFKGVDLRDTVIAGGAVLGSLLRFPDLLRDTLRQIELARRVLSMKLPKDLARYVEAFLNLEQIHRMCMLQLPINFTHSRGQFYYQAQTFKDSDIDIFLIVRSAEEAKRRVGEIVDALLKNAPSATPTFVRSRSTLTLVLGPPHRHVQFVLSLYRSVEEVLCFFDLDCVCCAYDGSRVFVTPRSVRALNTHNNFVDVKSFGKPVDQRRIRKYLSRGFQARVFENCIHEPRCDVVVGEVEFGLIDTMVKASKGGTQLEEPEEDGTGELKEEEENGYTNRSLPSGSVYNVARFVHSVNRASVTRGRGVVYHMQSSLAACWDVADMVGLRWKYVDSRLSRQGMVYLPRCYMCKTTRANTGNPQGKCGAQLPTDVTRATGPHSGLCELCHTLNKSKISQWVPNSLSHFVAIVTGGRIKIGFETALLLLRAGCTVIVTSRFPSVARQNFEKLPDFSQFSSRLYVYGLDLRDLIRVNQFVQVVTCKFKRIHILINNAAQTIARPLAYYRELIEIEQREQSSCAFPADGLQNVGLVAYQRMGSKKRGAEGSGLDPKRHCPPTATADGSTPTTTTTTAVVAITADEQQLQRVSFTSPADFKVSSLQPWTAESLKPSAAMACTAARDDALFPPGQYDAHGTQLDRRPLTSWNSCMDEVSPLEALEVHLVNSLAPFTLIQALKPHMLPLDPFLALEEGQDLDASTQIADCGFVINVSSVEGQFNGVKSSTHPHTNMAKASMNMLTRTIGKEFAQQGIYVCSVDTGWISKMTPFKTSSTAPLLPIDGAARICDPIFQGLSGKPQAGVFLQHFRVAPW